jgi:predicted MFS family arabinose efflux permease
MLHTYLAHLRALQRNARLFLLSNTIVSVSVSAVGIIYAIYLTRLGYSTSFLGLLLIVGIAGAGAGLVPAVVIANRLSARRLLLRSNIVGGFAVAGQLVFPQAWLLVMTTFIVGASASIFIVLTLPLLAATSTEEERAHLFSLNATAGFLAGVVGSALGGTLPVIMSARSVTESGLVRLASPLLAHGSALPVQLALFAAGALALPSQIPLILMDDTVIGADPESQPAPLSLPPRAEWSTLARQWRQRWLRLSVARAALAWPAARYVAYIGFLGLGAGLFTTYINLYFVNHLHTSTALFGDLSSVATIALALATLAGPVIAQRLGAVRGVIVTQSCAVPMVVVLALTLGVPIAAGAYLLHIVLMNMSQPALQSFVMGMLPAHERSAANSVFTVTAQALSAIGGAVSGVLIDRLGFGVTFVVAAICFWGGMLWLLPWFGRERALSSQAPISPGIVLDGGQVHEQRREAEA